MKQLDEIVNILLEMDKKTGKLDLVIEELSCQQAKEEKRSLRIPCWTQN
ncbi:MAG: hypothetical protein IEMM0008_0514 [bacterium]|nr:MAG: hypothetical protein IEMM0008_0514 [bacterium]